jgi:hypothetical protein
MPHPRDSVRLRCLAVLALTGTVGLAACSGGEDDAGEVAGTHAADASQIADGPQVSPLTGLAIPGRAPRHPVLAVKVDNSASSSPQVGLSAADMVTEELVEGGITRLAVFFYTKVPDVVGPVRSMRATDIGIVQPLGAALVASGGAPPTVRRVRDAEISTFTEGATGFYRDNNRSAPYNLFMQLTKLAPTVRATTVPAPYLPFGAASDFPQGQPASGLTASFSGASASTFEFRGGRYVNTDTNAGAEDQFQPDTVLVLRVEVGDAGYRDPAGNPVPETKFTGQGAAMLFHGGRMVRGTWVKDGLDADVQLRSGGGSLEVPAGKVWIELVPADGGNVTVSR